MWRNVRIGALAFVIATVCTAPATWAQSFPGDDEVRAILQQRITEGRAVGLVVGLLEADGSSRVVVAGSAGPDARPLGERSLFEIGSITKTFTAALLAEMVRREEVRLTDPVSRFLPQDVRVPERAGRQITLVDLATHTSALPRMPDNFTPADSQNPYADYSVVQLHEFIAGHELKRDIGARVEYSNVGMGLLGHVLARAAGSSYEEALRSRVLHPLGLHNTAVTLASAQRGWMAQGHDRTGNVVPLWDIPTLAGAGALRSDVIDMMRWLVVNMNEPSSDLERSLRTTHRARAAFDGPAGPDSMFIGLGWVIQSAGGSRIVWHNGGTGGFYSFAGFDPERRVGVVVLSNAAHPVDDIAHHMFDPSVPLSEPPRSRVEVEVADAILSGYVGTYRFNEQSSMTVAFENGQLLLVLPGQPRFRLHAESETDFFLRVVDAQITFLRDDDGVVIALEFTQAGRTMRALKVR
jgi:serine-type D-Ala-D-Ala carboxypeptidase/endopeptidase